MHPPESPQPGCFSHTRSHTRLSQTPADTHSFPLKEVVEMQSGLWLRTVQSPWGQIRWCRMRGGHGRPQAAFPGGAAHLTRSQGLGCTAERPEASLPHLSGGGKPGILETQWEGEKRAVKRTPRSPFLQLSLKQKGETRTQAELPAPGPHQARVSRRAKSQCEKEPWGRMNEHQSRNFTASVHREREDGGEGTSWRAGSPI